jgi:beta-phosphoglucomutase-like phosphatase (HAD superfamily)
VRPPALILDVDGVLIDWIGPFKRWMEHNKKLAPDWRARDDYSLTTIYPQISREEANACVEEFHRSYEYRRLTPLPWVEITLRHLREELPSLEIAVVSACGVEEKVVDSRRWQLRGLPINTLIPVEPHAHKGIAFSNYAPGSVVVEDHPGHLKAAAALDIRTIVFDQPWNRGVDYCDARISEWKGASAVIKSLLG